ncbi:degenerate transposase [Streptococcus pneumoniae]|nr:degenerate transposase [Streptococcus pneumoniae]CIV45743.1 degenerate transposase [Streptococcus pneumoniae]
MLYVGIDVAKNKHDVTALNVPGKTVLKPLTFSNNKAGFELLDLSLRQLNQDCLIALKLLSDPNREQFQHDNRQVDLKILARHIHRLKKNSLIGKYNTLVVLISSFLSWIKSLESIQNIPTNS